jgi:methylthioribose-1-phosphate isomerase
MYIAAPSSTFDLTIRSGDEIPIEERGSTEITHGFGRQTAPDGAKTYCPAFDVTPADLLAGIITERGLVEPPFERNIARVIGRTRKE